MAFGADPAAGVTAEAGKHFRSCRSNWAFKLYGMTHRSCNNQLTLLRMATVKKLSLKSFHGFQSGTSDTFWVLT